MTLSELHTGFDFAMGTFTTKPQAQPLALALSAALKERNIDTAVLVEGKKGAILIYLPKVPHYWWPRDATAQEIDEELNYIVKVYEG